MKSAGTVLSRLIFVAVTAIVVSACDSSRGSFVDGDDASDGSPAFPDSGCSSDCWEPVADFSLEVVRNVDILFVIDNSGSMSEEQASLAENFTRFIDVLQRAEGGLPSIHVGVISTDVGIGYPNIADCSAEGGGELQVAPRRASCATPEGPYIQDEVLIDDTRIRNYPDGQLAETFGCIAELGTSGCGFEQPLEAMKMALDGSVPGNGGFLRDDAWLVIVFITDEDDCSAADTTIFDSSDTSPSGPLGPLSSFRCTEFGVRCDGMDIARLPAVYDECTPRGDSYLTHPDLYVEFLRALKTDVDRPDYPRVIVSAIVGSGGPFEVAIDQRSYPMLSPSCASATGMAVPAVRLTSFVRTFAHHSIHNVCDSELSGPMERVAQMTTRAIGPCLGGAPSASPESYEAACQGHLEYGAEQTAVPACGADVPCWQLEWDPETCPASDSEAPIKVVVRTGTWVPPAGTRFVLECPAGISP